MSNVEIREMTRGDKPAIMDILAATPQFLPRELPVAEQVIDCYLDDVVGSGYVAYVAVVDSAVKGYVCFGETPLTEGTWDIYWIAVAASQQGHGLGKTLMSRAEAWMSKQGGRMILVETSGKPNYENTRLFYSGIGYHIACTIPDFYAPGDGKVVFQKRLR